MSQVLAIQATLDPKGVQVGAATIKRELVDVGVRATQSGQKVGAAASFSGEKMAKYATTAGMLTGSLQRLGVQNELLARSMSVIGDVVTGVAGKFGLIVVAIGVVTAAITTLIARQKALREETEKATTALANQGIYGVSAAMPGVKETTEAKLNELLDKRRELMEKISGIEDKVAGRAGSFWERSLPGSAKKWNEEITRLQAKLTELEPQILQLQTSLGVGVATMGEIGFNYTNIAVQRRAGLSAISTPGMQLPLGPVDIAGRQNASRVQPTSMRDLWNDPKRFELTKYDLSQLGLKPKEIEKLFDKQIAKPAGEALRQHVADGIYGGLQAARGGVDAFAAYFREVLIKEVLTLLATKLAIALIPGGEVVGGADADSTRVKSFQARGAMDQAAMWRAAR